MTTRVKHEVRNVTATLTHEGSEEVQAVPGTLKLVEKPVGVFLEFTPISPTSTKESSPTAQNSPQSMVESQWVVTSGSLSPRTENLPVDLRRVAFSVDIQDISSFTNREPKKDDKTERSTFVFHERNGARLPPLNIPSDATFAFLEHLQRYITLRRSRHDQSLVLVVDEKNELLVQSVQLLDPNQDMLERFLKNPFASTMTGFSRVTSFFHDQVIPAILDSNDAVAQEEQIRAIRELSTKTDNLSVTRDTDFELITQLELPPRPQIYRETPVTKKIWEENRRAADRSFPLQRVHHVKQLIFRGGLDPEMRPEVWKYLLGYYKWSNSPEENKKLAASLRADYERMRAQWKSVSVDQEKRWLRFQCAKALVEKDVARTDRTVAAFSNEAGDGLMKLNNVLMTYCMYNFDLGYVQGMSDFASPLVHVMHDEADAFWCFVRLMERVHRNFEEDQSTIKQQLNSLRDLTMLVNPKLANYLEAHESDDMYFCFRWVLVHFKRELTFDQTQRFWEVLWTDQPCPSFFLLCCVAILDANANVIVESRFGLTEILKHINDLAMHLNVDDVLTAAEAIFHQLSAKQDMLPRHICDYLGLGDQRKQ